MENQLLSYLQLLKQISTEDGHIITCFFDLKSFKEGDLLFEANGKICRELFFVCSGILRITSVNDKGVELTHYFYKENMFCTILQSFNDETPATASIQAACDAEVLVISKSKLNALYKEIPYFKELIDQQNQLRLIDKVNMRNIFLGEDAESRYKLFVLQNPDIALRVALKDIASYLGITPQSLSRIRKHMH